MLLAVGGEQNLLLTLGGHQLCFFVIAMACHGELARTRPAAKYLTGFYVALSFGGMVGGLFAGLIAPFTFSWIAEYPILLALAALCRPPGGEERLAALEQVVLAVSRGARGGSDRAVLLQREGVRMARDHRVWLIGAVGVLSALLALGLNANRWKIFATVVVALVVICGLSVRRRAGGNGAQFLRRPQDRGDVERPVSRADARHHDSRRREIQE